MRKNYSIFFTDGSEERMFLSYEEVRLIRFNENKKVSRILPLDTNSVRRKERNNRISCF